MNLLQCTGVGKARHVYFTGSRPLAHSYANEINCSERIHEQGTLRC